VNFSHFIKSEKYTFFKYIVSSGLNYLLVMLTIYTLHYLFGCSLVVSIALAYLSVAIYSFFLLRNLVFDKYNLYKEAKRMLVLVVAGIFTAILLGLVIDANDFSVSFTFLIPWVTLLQNYLVSRYYVWPVSWLRKLERSGE